MFEPAEIEGLAESLKLIVLKWTSRSLEGPKVPRPLNLEELSRCALVRLREFNITWKADSHRVHHIERTYGVPEEYCCTVLPSLIQV
jgi:hypothetical protein